MAAAQSWTNGSANTLVIGGVAASGSAKVTNDYTGGTTVSAGTLTLSGSGSNLNWMHTNAAVPEPTSALAGLLLATGLLRRKRS